MPSSAGSVPPGAQGAAAPRDDDPRRHLGAGGRPHRARRSLDALIALAGEGHRLSISAIVLYEWLRGPRTRTELAIQEDLFPRARAVPFGAAQAAVAARLYGAVKRPRGREIDLAVAACALHDGAALWTLNRADFRDLPDLALI